ncbi:PREDICTED: mitochondrial thiamine pyrophosphate carrier-like [Priapulus caudatus]|uniref:Mitochondrial thiamine pyrophosphate carrier-like n=1 Tax=Priapulus caudatus TaxID=37621 RepID=A0ABM1ENM4_PRICU|nr:PREDICTED: mitochondrial thiamine pyrophosphate carrier-like [Priapulus caudatus]
MVGFDPHDSVTLTQSQQALAGASSGIVTRLVTQPLDVLKIRFQLQIEPVSQRSKCNSKYKSVWQAFKLIKLEEGVPALWKGHVPGQGCSIIYGVFLFVVFETITRDVWAYLPHSVTTDWREEVHFICGGLSGALASVAAQPMDVMRTRLIAQGEPKVSVEIACCHLVCGAVTKSSAMVERIVCGSASGMSAKLAVQPLDFVKKRLQVCGFEEARTRFGQVGGAIRSSSVAVTGVEVRTYHGTIHCICSVFKHEGVAGFYKGTVPSLIKASSVTCLSFLVYEQFCDMLRYYRQRRHVS